MWGFLASVFIIIGLANPVFLPVGIFCAWMEWRAEKTASIRARARANINNGPAPCPSCGSKLWQRVGPASIRPAQGIRSFQFPMTGQATLRTFQCARCGVQGRYGFASDAPERGWIPLTAYMRGW